MIRLDKVSKSFGNHKVLDGIHLNVIEGEQVALLGLSGSGKTTALKLICGLHWPDSGEVFIRGEVLDVKNLRSTRLKMGYVIQSGGLFPHLTAKQNVTIVAHELKWPKDKLEDRLSDLVRMTKFPSSALDRFPSEISGGQRKRLSLMRALFLNPDLLLLDEPLGALDPITRTDLQDELKELFSSLKKTVVLVTHDLFEAGFLAGRILLLHGGSVVQEGSWDDLVHRPQNEFVKKFVRAQRAAN